MAATVSPIANLQLLNYEDWSFRMKVYLLAEDVWDVVEATTKPPKPEDGEVEFKAWRKNNAKALLTIQTCCGDDNYHLIKGISTAKAAWDTLAANLKPSEKGTEVKSSRDESDTIGTEVESSSETGHNNNNNDDSAVNVNHGCLYKSLNSGDWNAAKKYIDQHSGSLKHRGSSSGGTALHEAIESEQFEIVEELLKLMTKEDLEIQDDHGFTAFFYALQKGKAKIVASMIKKNENLVTMRCCGNMTPVVFASTSGHWDIARCLYDHTPIHVLTEDYNGRDGAELISQTFVHRNKYDIDIGWELLQKCPKLVLTEDYFEQSPLNAMASFRSAFLSGIPLKFWQRWIYNNIHVQQLQPSPINSDVCVNFEELEDDKRNQRDLISSDIHVQQPQPAPINSDLCVNLEELKDDKRNGRDLTSSVIGFFQGVVKNLLKLLGIHNLHEMRLRHDRILQFLPLVCEVATCRNLDWKQTAFVERAIFRAVERGQVEFIKEMCKANPRIPLMTKDESGRTLLHYAVECRQEKVFNFIYGLNKYDRATILTSADGSSDTCRTTILHAAGSLSAHVNHIQGAALQMQRELQWFKEVESILPPQDREIRNVTEKMTAREVFTKNHKKLRKEGEESMKGTATSCTVVGALIVTIMFAAAFTVPGGSNQDTGFPIFLRKKLFRIFIISDSISLFSSTTSVMIFLGILTSRYAEDDFLRSLPTKMLLGLFTLFLSIATMMVAFSSTLFIMFEGESWVYIPIILLASVPIASFVLMQFPLFLDIFMFTYGRGILDKKCRAWE